jgi:hypothetical protein
MHVIKEITIIVYSNRIRHPAVVFAHRLNGMAALSVGRSDILLLVLASTVLVSDPVGTHDHIFVVSKTLRVLKWGLLFDGRVVWLLLVTPPLLGVTRAGTLCVGKSME